MRRSTTRRGFAVPCAPRKIALALKYVKNETKLNRKSRDLFTNVFSYVSKSGSLINIYGNNWYAKFLQLFLYKNLHLYLTTNTEY